MGAGECAHDLGPHARSSPANEPIVAGRVRTEVVRQIAPWRPRSQNPKDAIEDTTVIHSWHAARLIWQHQFDGNPLIVGEFVAHDSTPSVGGLNHGSAVRLNPPGQGALRSLFPQSGPIMLALSFVVHDPYRRFATRLRCGATDVVKRARCPALACLLAHGKAATTITSTSIPGRQKSVVRQARAGGLARSTHSFQTEL